MSAPLSPMAALCDRLADEAMAEVRGMTPMVHVVVLAFECKPPNGEIGKATVAATFTDNDGLHVAASIVHQMWERHALVRANGEHHGH